MKFSEFIASLSHEMPPENINDLLKALWHDHRNDWDKAHNLVQDIHTTDGSLIHAYLHRKEGDPGNARYWYNRAGEQMYAGTLEEEWNALAKKYLL